MAVLLRFVQIHGVFLWGLASVDSYLRDTQIHRFLLVYFSMTPNIAGLRVRFVHGGGVGVL